MAPVGGYIPQYLEMTRRRSLGAFSPLVSLILLAASVARTFFWVAKRFNTALLLQALVMIVAQLVLVELVARLSRENQRSLPGEHHKLPDVSSIFTRKWWSQEYFWRWRDFQSYLAVVGLLVGVLSILGTVFADSSSYAEVLGIFFKFPAFAALLLSSQFCLVSVSFC